MDMKRFTEIKGREALERLSNGLDVFNRAGQKYCIEGSKHVRYFDGSRKLNSTLTINDFLSGTWYVKKPFDVRAEMLARPNEWVGAYRDDMGYWHKVGLDLQKMHVTEASIFSDKTPYQVRQRVILSSDLDNCVPIDEAIEEVM